MLLPMLLSTVAVQGKVLDDFLVGALGLAIGLRVIGRGEVGLDSKVLQKGAHES